MKGWGGAGVAPEEGATGRLPAGEDPSVATAQSSLDSTGFQCQKSPLFRERQFHF